MYEDTSLRPLLPTLWQIKLGLQGKAGLGFRAIGVVKMMLWLILKPLILVLLKEVTHNVRSKKC